MKTALLLPLVFVHLLSRSQDSVTTYHLKQVDWTIQLPAAFTILEDAVNQKKMERGAKAVEESTGIKAEFKTTKTLLTATNGYNYFTVTITPFDPTINGSYAASTQAVNEMITKTFKEKIQNGIVDTASTKKTIDGLEFSDFRVTVRMGDKVLFTSSLLSRLYKGYDFGISCLYVDEKAKTLLESMLDTSRFTK